MKSNLVVFVVAACACLMTGCSSPAPDSTSTAFTPVKAVSPGTANPASAPATAPRPASELKIGQGRFFKYAMPADWHVGEDGQFALTLMSADNQALTVMVGNAGMQPNYPADRYAYERLMSLQPQNLQVTGGRQAPPVSGFRGAYVFDVSYSLRGVSCRGQAKVSIAPAYDTQTMAMTASLATADAWAGYSSWLPLVADQISAIDGGAFGTRGLMAQNLANSTAYADAASKYRDWSQQNWQQVTDQRNASTDKNNADFRDALGGVQPYSNPFGSSAPVEMPNTYKYYWVDVHGNMVGTDNPSANPNVGSTVEWRQMERVKR